MKSTIRLLILNAFRSSLKSIYQILGLSSLIFLISLILSLFFATTDNIIKSNTLLTHNSVIRDAVYSVDQNNQINLDKSNLKKELINLNQNSQEVYRQDIINHYSNDYLWSRTEGRTFSEIKMNDRSLLIKAITKFGDNSNNYIKNGPNIFSSSVDKLVVSQSLSINGTKNLQEIFKNQTQNVRAHEVVIQQNFAQKNNIKLGDIIRIEKDSYSKDKGNQFIVTSDPIIRSNLEKQLNGKNWFENYQNTQYSNANWYEVVGYGQSADFAAPIINETTTLPDITKNVLVYLDPSVFGYDTYNSVNSKIINYNASHAKLVVVSNSDIEIYYSLKLKDSYLSHLINKSYGIEQINNLINQGIGNFTNSKIVYSNDDKNYKYNNRVTMFEKVTETYNIVSAVLLIIVVGISVIVIFLTTKKYVDSVQKQIGCLKALGYRKREIVNNFIAIPLITTSIGVILGYLGSLGVENGVLHGFQLYFNINFPAVSFSVLSFILSIGVTFIFMVIIAFSTAYFVIKDSALRLLNGSMENKVGVLAKACKKLNWNKSFNGRLHSALMSSSIGKLSAMAITMFLSTSLLTGTVMAPKIMKDNVSENFAGLKYKNEVEYEAPQWNNPLSFYRTFNPIYDISGESLKDGWGFTQDKINNPIEDYLQSEEGQTTSASSPLPITKSNGKVQIDYQNLFNDILEDKLSAYYYCMDNIRKSDTGSEWGKMAYENWKALPVTFLKYLSSVELKGWIAQLTISTLAKQWPDYISINDVISKCKNNIDLYQNLFTFYIKYSSGLKLDYNVSSTDDTAYKMLSSISTPIYNKKVDYSNYYKLLSIKNNNDFTFNIFPSSNIKEQINLKDASFEQLEKKFTGKELSTIIDQLNIEILRWFYGTTYLKLGTILLETAYSRSPYFVQEKIKNAYNNDLFYELAFNINPYNPKTDDLGTMLNGTYRQKNQKTNLIKIYGINKNQKTINLNSNVDALYQKTIDGSVPIVINKTTAIKANLKVGSNVNISYILNQLEDSSNIAAELNIDKTTGLVTNPKVQTQPYYTPESAMSYYSLKGSYAFLDNAFEGIEPASVDGQKISAEGSFLSTNPLPSIKAATSGLIKVGNENINKTFKVVGIQNSYGNSQAWISQENANHLMKYDQTQEYLFKNFFVPQFVNVFNNKNQTSNIKYIDLSKINYSDLVSKSKEDEAARIALKMFNNLYPIYNYKNSLDPNTYDVSNEANTWQPFGDYSAIGLNGGYDEQIGKEKIYYEGLGQGATSLIYPLVQARQILIQITDIVDMVIILFLVIAIVISLTIIMVATSIILRENLQFIATMKVLGYDNDYIIRQVLGMYIGIIVVSFMVGFLASWYGIQALSMELAQNSSWVLPIVFYWWYPIAVVGIVGVIYILSCFVGLIAIKKIHPLKALQMEN